MRPVSPLPASPLGEARRREAAAERGWAPRLRSGLARCKAAWAAWRLRRRYRRDLERLLRISPRLIEDIGLSPEDVEQEVPRPFWFI